MILRVHVVCFYTTLYLRVSEPPYGLTPAAGAPRLLAGAPKAPWADPSDPDITGPVICIFVMSGFLVMMTHILTRAHWALEGLAIGVRPRLASIGSYPDIGMQIVHCRLPPPTAFAAGCCHWRVL